MYDAMGEHKVRILDKKIEIIQDPDIKPDRLDAELDSLMKSLWDICRDMEHRGRSVPPTKTELHSMFKLKRLRKLVDAGMLTEKVIAITPKGGGKNVGSRSCLMFTELGRVYGKVYHDLV
jgi:hypothetical protein